MSQSLRLVIFVQDLTLQVNSTFKFSYLYHSESYHLGCPGMFEMTVTASNKENPSLICY